MNDETEILDGRVYKFLERCELDSKIISHTEQLEKVISRSASGSVSILSIVGTSTQVNFMVGYALSYLESIHATGSLSPPVCDFINGFLWKDGDIPDQEEVATWIFAKPFIIKKGINANTAVIVLYTHIPQNFLLTEDKAMDAIIGLNMLLSSTMIIDCFKQLTANIFQRLKNFTKCGMIGIDEKSASSTPFQSLSFFVRDWNYPTDFPFGEIGGQRYLDKMFSQAPGLQKMKEELTNLFSSLNCQLIPFPGLRAVSPSFTGLVVDLDSVYVKTLRNFFDTFIQTMITHSNKKYKTGQSILPFVESYVRALNQGYVSNNAYQCSSKKKDPTKTSSVSTRSKQKTEKTKGSIKTGGESDEQMYKHQSNKKSSKPEQIALNSNLNYEHTSNPSVIEIDQKKDNTSPRQHPTNVSQKINSETPRDDKGRKEPTYSSQNATNVDVLPDAKHLQSKNQKIVSKAVKKFQTSMQKTLTKNALEYFSSQQQCTKAYEKASSKALALLNKQISAAEGSSPQDDKIRRDLEQSVLKAIKEEYESIMQKNEEMIKIVPNSNKVLTHENVESPSKPRSFGETLTDQKGSPTKQINISSHLPAKQQINNENRSSSANMQSKLPKPGITQTENVESVMQNLISDYCMQIRKFLDTIGGNDEADSLKKWHLETRSQYIEKLASKLQGNNNPILETFTAKMEEEYTSVVNELHKNLENQKLATNKLLRDFTTLYVDELQRKAETLSTPDDEYYKENRERMDAILELFKNAYKYPKGSLCFKERLDELADQLSIAHKEHKRFIDQRNLERETNINTAIDEAICMYKEKMTNLIDTQNFVSDNELRNYNEQFGNEATHLCLKTIATFNVPAEMVPSEEIVLLKLSKHFLGFKAQNNQNRALGLSETKNLVTECLSHYNSCVSKGMILVWNKESLESLHKDAMEQAFTVLRSQCVKQNDTEFLKPYVQELQNDIEAAYKEIAEYYNMKSRHEEDTINAALAKGRELYNMEMDTHFKNHEFIRPDFLEKLHKDVSGRVITSCFEDNIFLKDEHKLQLKKGIDLIFEKYKQQNDMNFQSEPAIGIDLGTTYSCVAVYSKGKVHVIRNSSGKDTTPSYVAFGKDGEEIIGEPAKTRAYENPESTIFDAKRIIGRRFNDSALQHDMKLWPFNVVDDFGVPKILAGGKKMHPEEVSAKLLRHLKKDAEKYLQQDVKKAVITVPAYFSDGQRQATKDAGKMAGLEILNVQTEPTAAAVAYKLQHYDGKERKVLIFDLGGGTFDVAVLKMNQGTIDVLAVDGDTHLGGEDFDQTLMEYCATEFKRQHNIDLFEGKDSDVKQSKDQARRQLKRLKAECERKKVDLTASFAAVVTVDRIHGDTDLSIKVTRQLFEDLNSSLFKKTIEVVDSALLAAKLNKSEIDDVVLVGGSTRIPKVQEMLSKHFGGKALDHYINPDEAVAYGAAMTAAYLNGTVAKNSVDFNKIQDVTPMSLGVEVYGGGFSVIIPRSTKIPVKLQERYKTAHNNQTSVQITIYQGEDPIAVKNQHLGDFYLNGIPAKAAEVENIDVEMIINSQGILHVSAASSSTGGKSVSVIENKFRIGEAAIQRFLQEAP